MAAIVEGFPILVQDVTEYTHISVCVFGTMRTLHWIHFLAKKEAMPACFAGGATPFFAAGFALLSAAFGAVFFSAAAGAGLSAAADAAAAAEDLTRRDEIRLANMRRDGKMTCDAIRLGGAARRDALKTRAGLT